MGVHTYRTTEPRQGASQPRRPFAKITPWHVANLEPAELRVLIGILLELAVGETRICTSSDIAAWGRLSEALVSKALPGLAAKGVIRLARVVYTETGRRRWALTPRAARDDGSYPPPEEGSGQDVTLAEGSDRDGCKPPKTGDSGVQTPKKTKGRFVASQSQGSCADPRIFYDSDHELASSDASRFPQPAPGSRTARPNTPPGSAAPPPADSETPTVLPAFAELLARGVSPVLAADILRHHPAMDGATFDALVTTVARRPKRPHSPKGTVISVLASGQLPGDAPAPPAASRPSLSEIHDDKTISPADAQRWLRIVRTDPNPHAALERFRAARPGMQAAFRAQQEAML